MENSLTQAFLGLLVLDAVVAVGLWFILSRITKLTKGKITSIVAAVGFSPFCGIFTWALFPEIGVYSLFLLGIPIFMFFIGPFYWRCLKTYQEILKKSYKN
ncbi:hypothetical protein [Desulfosporosinus youngiae]|uniref:Uncharacterized protein n=1 Tax=Desulfosporosinus youngiae DSM 17734 TaxID=768710 RepID=H5XVN2_9FIRM|nr:hypothetical protein [Desulfosporosinus youngiae]EHQ90115.1 hypothetical protein DesyoDRAFT_3075 [Desulfosporosinus youngiae DSM 17734]